MERTYMRNGGQFSLALILLPLPGTFAFLLTVFLSAEAEDPTLAFWIIAPLLYLPDGIVLIHLLRRAIWCLDRVTIGPDGVRVSRFGRIRQAFSWEQIQEYGIIWPVAENTTEADSILYFSVKRLTDEERVLLNMHSEYWVEPVQHNDDVILLKCVVRGKAFRANLSQQMLALIPSSPLQGYSIERQWLVYPCLYTRDGQTIERMDVKTGKDLIQRLIKPANLAGYIMIALSTCSWILAVIITNI